MDDGWEPNFPTVNDNSKNKDVLDDMTDGVKEDNDSL